jgi:arylsulfatase A-like enzyme
MRFTMEHESPPNVLIILADQLRRQALGCYGDPNVRTPNIDALAQRGVRFSAACSTYPVCVPFRFSFMTGQYAHTRMVPALHWRMSPAERTLADAFNEAGYHTLYVGKWHLEGTAPPVPVPRCRQGRWQKWLGFELRNSHFDTFYFEDDDPTPKPLGKYQTDGLFDLAMEHLETSRPMDRPFCAVLSVEPPHFPYEAPEEYEDRWRDRELVLPETFELPDEYEVPLSHWPNDAAGTAETKMAQVRTYYAMIENLDDNIGRMMAFLEDRGLNEKTVVLIVSDHGEMGGAHALPTAMKEYPFEESVGIPLIIHDPRLQGSRRGAVVDEPVCTEDLFPTICALGGISPRDSLPGRDLTPLARGDRASLDREGILLESVHEFRKLGAFFNRSFRAIRTRRYKYSVLAGRGGPRPWQLFDLQRDPAEARNLLSDPAHHSLAVEMHGKLRDLLARSEDHFDPGPGPGEQ